MSTRQLVERASGTHAPSRSLSLNPPTLHPPTLQISDQDRSRHRSQVVPAYRPPSERNTADSSNPARPPNRDPRLSQQSRHSFPCHSIQPDSFRSTPPVEPPRFTLPISRRSNTSTSTTVARPKEWTTAAPKRTINAVRQASQQSAESKVKKSKKKKKEVEVEKLGPLVLDEPEEGRWVNGQWVKAPPPPEDPAGSQDTNEVSQTYQGGSQGEAAGLREDSDIKRSILLDRLRSRDQAVGSGRRRSDGAENGDFTSCQVPDLTYENRKPTSRPISTSVHHSKLLKRDSLGNDLRANQQDHLAKSTWNPRGQEPLFLPVEDSEDDEHGQNPADQACSPSIDPEGVGRPSTRRSEVYKRIYDPDEVHCLHDAMAETDNRSNNGSQYFLPERSPLIHPTSSNRDDPMPYLQNGMYTRSSPPAPFLYSNALTQDTSYETQSPALPQQQATLPSPRQRPHVQLRKHKTYSKKQPTRYAIPNLSSQALDDGMSYHYDRHKRAGSTSIWPDSNPEPAFQPQHYENPLSSVDDHPDSAEETEDETRHSQPKHRIARGRERNGKWPDVGVLDLFPLTENDQAQMRQYLHRNWMPLQDRFQPYADDGIPQPLNLLDRHHSMGRYIPHEKRRMYRYGDRAFGRVHPDLNGPQLRMTRREQGDDQIDQ